ncbi:MAG TPA: phenylalanine--tRNA ligase beta subunit-related protein, partial [Thermoanaerobaculia bacterium]
MLFSRDWLSDYVDLPADPGEIAAGLTEVGLAVEGVEAADGDVLIDVDVTTNRPDAMCHLGLAREAAVRFGSALRPPAAAPPETAEAAADVVTVTLDDPEGCPRYVARVVRGLTVGPSPDWLARRLRAIGLRPINNVVDVTNYVLWETGQPLHAFDLAKLATGDGGRVGIVVRRAGAGERLTTLDGEARELSPEVLVIADRERPVALAGILGGADSEVTAATRDVLIESAHFDRRRVRLGARQLGLKTDASHRFERGADPGACRAAA